MVEKSSTSGNWYYLIDGIRGFALLNMLLYHFFFDIYVIFDLNSRWYSHPAVRVWQQFICITFLLVSGISWHFSKNNLKRGILVNLYGLLITVVTLVFMPSQTVWFGILNCIGCATLLMIPFHKLFDRLSRRLASRKVLFYIAGLIITLALFLFTRYMDDGYLNAFGYHLYLPRWLYAFWPMTILGFPHSGFASGDYFPILPWFFLFTAGYFIWELISCRPSLVKLFHTKIPVLSRIGKRTIWIYLLHQPLLYALAYLLVHIAGLDFT